MRVDRERWRNGLIGHWDHPSDLLDETLVSDWESASDFCKLPLPIRIGPMKTIGLDLVAIEPMSAPTGMLFYMDVTITYTDEEQIEMDPVKWMRANIEWVTIRTK
jgi:hypothetical protein